MNERIKELAKKSRLFDNNGNPRYNGENKDVEMFAELIIRECAKTAGDFEYARLHDSLVENHILEHFGVEEKKEQTDEEYVTKEEFYKCIKILTEMLDRKQNAPPSIASPFVNKPLSERSCWVCNLPTDKPMGYVCTHQNCPSRVTCGTAQEKVYSGGYAVQNTGAVSGYMDWGPK